MKSAEDPDSAAELTDIGPTSAVAPGQAVAFEASGRSVLVCNADGTYYAVASRCTHAAWNLVGNEIVAAELICALHGARFDLRTGAATCLPATKPLRTFPLTVREGRILVRVPPALV